MRGKHPAEVEGRLLSLGFALLGAFLLLGAGIVAARERWLLATLLLIYGAVSVWVARPTFLAELRQRHGRLRTPKRVTRNRSRKQSTRSNSSLLPIGAGPGCRPCRLTTGARGCAHAT